MSGGCCHATDCLAETVRDRIMCSPHWYMATPLTRARWRSAARALRSSEEARTNREFLEATADLIDEVALAEDKPIGSVWRTQLGRINAGEK